jgi:hypothetical protein
VDIIEGYLDDRSEYIILRTPVRFDFDAKRSKSEEPHAHVHFNHEDCRCAVSAPIFPCYFVKFVMRYFYPDLWERYPVMKSIDQEMVGHWLKDDEEFFLHFTARKSLHIE